LNILEKITSENYEFSEWWGYYFKWHLYLFFAEPHPISLHLNLIKVRGPELHGRPGRAICPSSASFLPEHRIKKIYSIMKRYIPALNAKKYASIY
jgi:hypothetical protein